MSTKAITRVTVFVLISLVLIAATSMSVRGWFSNASTVAGAQVYVLGSLTSNEISQQPAAASSVDDYFSQKGSGHNCESEGVTSSDD